MDEPGAVPAKPKLVNTARNFLPDEREMVHSNSKTLRRVTWFCQYTKPVTGRLMVTNFRLIFSGKSDEAPVMTYIDVLLGNIAQIDSNIKSGAATMEVHCKDFRLLRFELRSSSANSDVKQIIDQIQVLAFPIAKGFPLSNLPAFHYRESFGKDGWGVYDAEAEYRRFGLPNEAWIITDVNKDFSLCDTYPTKLVVPKQAVERTDDGQSRPSGTHDYHFLRKVAQFRSRGRIPVLSWLHPESRASITRCAQPMVSVRGQRSSEDEEYVSMIAEINANHPKLFVADARPFANAVANKARGGGTESDANYKSIELHFCDIPNIHTVRSDYEKLKSLCYPLVDDDHFHSRLESTKWLDVIQKILSGAVLIAQKVEEYKTSVMVHCSDGWDRTAQLTTLLMLDPYYRTIEGFQVLIEKEWCSFGHKFAQRYGHGISTEASSEVSPVFVQFIDCTYQMIEQFPSEFEFTEIYLITILDHLYSCLFGTFLENCEKERVNGRVREQTVSLWSYMNWSRERFTNVFYLDAKRRDGPHVLYPSSSIRQLKFWQGYYLRYHPNVISPAISTLRQRLLLKARDYLQQKADSMKKEVLEKDMSQAKTSVV